MNTNQRLGRNADGTTDPRSRPLQARHLPGEICREAVRRVLGTIAAAMNALVPAAAQPVRIKVRNRRRS